MKTQKLVRRLVLKIDGKEIGITVSANNFNKTLDKYYAMENVEIICWGEVTVSN